VKESDMIRAALTFPLSMTDLVTKTIMHLPEILRPTVISLAEDEPATAIGDINVFLDTFKMPTIGVYLENSTVQYDLRRFQKNTLIVDADLGDISDDVVRDFLIQHGGPAPVLRLRLYTGGIGVPESHHRQIWHQHNGKLGRTRHPEIYTGLISVDVAAGFIGRTTRRPALYPVRAAQEHIELEGQQHLLRFYESPEDWRSAAVMAELYHSCPGIFDVEKLRPKLQGMTNFLEINAILHDWT
jgi:hypothetical protein